ncbi:PQQ-binding-like beta-propeller repeat protein [Nonomuraea sp. NPDC046570]|uniref:outer membrane protein assembly factor BamB family protein n=1 Tax=Nonomuraea sp. NPDC046570 TaxID=3155255 RepID=UPI0033FE6695
MIGKTLWERQLHQRGSTSALAIAGDRVVVHERHNRLACLDRHDGAVRWDVPVGTWPRAVVVYGDRCLVLPQNSDQLVCLDLPTGSVMWRAGLRGYSGHVVATPEAVLVGGWRGYTPIVAVNLQDGRPLWRTQQCAATVRPEPWGGGVMLGSGSEAWLIDPRDGMELGRWRLPEPLADTDNRQAFTVIGPDRCLALCGTRSVAAMRLSSSIVEQLFRHDTGLLGFAPEFTGGVVWLRDRQGGYLAVDPEDGSELWHVDVAQPLADGVVRDGDGFVIGSQGGVLLRLRSDGQVLERASSAARIAALRGLGTGEVIMVTKGTLRMIAVGPFRRGE